MQIHEIKRNTPNRKNKRVGRGGKRGKTSGHGTKGQKARAGRKLRPEMRDIIKRLPKRRGYGKNRARTVNDSVIKPDVLNVGTIEMIFEQGDTIDIPALFEKKLVRRHNGKMPAVKILGNGNLTKKFIFNGVAVSDTAKQKIEKAGGSVG